jgi:hypothetical protein
VPTIWYCRLATSETSKEIEEMLKNLFVCVLQVDRVIRRLDKELETIVSEIGSGNKMSTTDKGPRKFILHDQWFFD